MYTNDVDYTDGRLRHTVIRLKDGEPVYCEAVRKENNNNLILWYKPLKGGNLKNKNIREFNLSSPQLGYTNYEGKCYYLSRYPMRRDWKQGVRPGNVAIFKGTSLTKYNLPLPSLITPILGKYPCYKEVVDRVEDVYDNCAFSRYFSLDHKGRIFYKHRFIVGEDKEGVPTLTEKNFWLAELLQEEMENNNDRVT